MSTSMSILQVPMHSCDASIPTRASDHMCSLQAALTAEREAGAKGRDKARADQTLLAKEVKRLRGELAKVGD